MNSAPGGRTGKASTEKNDGAAWTLYDNNNSPLAEGEMEGGRHVVRWDASGLASGVYVIQIQAGDQSKSVKCLLLK